MAHKLFIRTIIAGSTIAGTFFCGFARAQSVADFYSHAPITMYVASGAGGGFDTYARVFVTHYKDHIPGHPNIVVKNMPGAAGLVAINYLYNSAPRDGSSILASFNTVILSSLYGHSNAKFDPRQMGWIGSIGKQTGTCLTWHTSPVKTMEDARSQEVFVSSTGETTVSMYPKLLNAMLGTKFKIVTGYSTSGMRLAVENGEVQGLCGLAWETLMAAAPSWILDNKVNFLVQLGLSPSPHLRGVPLAIDQIQMPANRQVFELLSIPEEFGRPIVASPGMPSDRLAALQKAFDETMKDNDYLADADKAHQFVDPLSAKEMRLLIDRAYADPNDIVTRAADYAFFQ